jgi:hypothetical protein
VHVWGGGWSAKIEPPTPLPLNPVKAVFVVLSLGGQIYDIRYCDASVKFKKEGEV